MRRTFNFPTLRAFHDAIDPSKAKHHPSPSWAGATRQQAAERRYSWPDAVAQLSALPELSAPIAHGVTVKTWAEDDGDEMSPERYAAGLPFLLRRVKQRGNRNRAPVCVIVNLTESARVPIDALRWKAYAAARFVDELEATGTRCEVIAADCCAGSWRNGDDLALSITVKRAEEPLNLAALLAAVAPWMMRQCLPDFIDTHGRSASGYGSPRRWPADLTPPGAIVIDSGACLSQHDAAAFISQAGEAR